MDALITIYTNTAMGYGLDGRDSNFWQGQEIFLHSTEFRLDLGPNQPPTQRELGVNWQGHETDHSSPPSAKVDAQ
jgi:hypothetical protein